MDDNKLRLLFGPVGWEGVDLDDPEERAGLLEDSTRELTPARLAVREVLAGQILAEDPPEVWAAARRLMNAGLDRERVLNQLSMALTSVMAEALSTEGAGDPAAYADALALLPLPTADELEEGLVRVVRERPGVSVEEAERAVLQGLGRRDDDELSRRLLDRVSDRLVDDDGPLAMLCGDRTVHVGDLTSRTVLTHRVTATEREIGCLTVGFDLVGFARRDDVRLPSGAELEAFSVEPGHVAWGGPEGWLDGYSEDELVAVRVDGDGVVTIDRLPAAPEVDAELVDRLRRVYDAEVDEPGMPVPAEDLVLGLLVEDREAFAAPRPPLADLCSAAGLERRGHQVAHDEDIWANERRERRMWQVMDRLDSGPMQEAALAALAAADEDETDAERLRAAARGLHDPTVLEVVADLLFGMDDDPELVSSVGVFSERLLEAATRPTEVAPARWLAAVAAERRGEPIVAEAHLHLAAEADSCWGPAIDRLAWYASDRGDAPMAARLWQRLGIGRDINQDLRTVEPFARSATPKLGRNEPCWCGSGRKFKHCHAGQAMPLALSDRVGWLCRKAAAYLERRGGSVRGDVIEYATAAAADPDDPDSIAETFQDPLVIDVALNECGWFDRFLDERGALLPDDEAMLAAAWALVPRTVYEVVETRPGSGLTLRDLGAGEVVEVRERSFSRQAKPGQVICARAVPDGDEGHQLIGAVFSVTPGTESDVLRLCDEGDGLALCAYVAARKRPPTLQTREGEPLIVCEATIDVRDPREARRVLDLHYEPEGGDTWVEMHALNEDERIVRAHLSLDRARLKVLTHSEPRMDRVLTSLKAELPDVQVLRDKRKPLRAGDLPPAPPGAQPASREPVPPEAMEQIRDTFERRWLHEQIPALGGLTPVEAAADLTRVEQLERLLATFPEPDDADLLTMRPQRIRELLGLPERIRP